MRCAICGEPITSGPERLVPTADGQYVHLACADREAIAAWQQRQRDALLHGGLLLVGTLVLVGALGLTLGVLVLLMVGVAAHVTIHRRWWLHITLPLRRACRHKVPR